MNYLLDTVPTSRIVVIGFYFLATFFLALACVALWAEREGVKVDEEGK
jgi:hypothetical protein